MCLHACGQMEVHLSMRGTTVYVNRASAKSKEGVSLAKDRSAFIPFPVSLCS